MTESRPTTIDGLRVALFAYPGRLRDRLVAAILRGEKTATSSLRTEYLPGGADALPVVGERWVVVDSQHRPVAIVETTEVRVIALRDVDAKFATDEGEGFASVAAWRESHERFWRAGDAAAGADRHSLSDDTLVVAERFRFVRRVG